MAITKRKNIDKKLKQAVWDKTDGRCWYCGKVTIPEGIGNYRDEPNIDHQDPTSRGGETTIENLVLACSGCNMDKRTLTVDEFREEVRQRSDYFMDQMAEEVNGFPAWERGQLHDEFSTALRDLNEWKRTRTVVFYGEQIGSKPLDYCI